MHVHFMKFFLENFIVSLQYTYVYLNLGGKYGFWLKIGPKKVKIWQITTSPEQYLQILCTRSRILQNVYKQNSTLLCTILSTKCKIMQNSTKLFFTAWFSSQKCTLSYNISGGGETRPKEPKFEEKSILKKVLIFDLIQHMAAVIQSACILWSAITWKISSEISSHGPPDNILQG